MPSVAVGLTSAFEGAIAKLLPEGHGRSPTHAPQVGRPELCRGYKEKSGLILTFVWGGRYSRARAIRWKELTEAACLGEVKRGGNGAISVKSIRLYGLPNSPRPVGPGLRRIRCAPAWKGRTGME